MKVTEIVGKLEVARMCMSDFMRDAEKFRDDDDQAARDIKDCRHDYQLYGKAIEILYQTTLYKQEDSQ